MEQEFAIYFVSPSDKVDEHSLGTWVSLWHCKPSDLVNALSHSSHLYGLSPVWIRSWACQCEYHWNGLPQNRQLYFSFLMFIFSCDEETLVEIESAGVSFAALDSPERAAPFLDTSFCRNGWSIIDALLLSLFEDNVFPAQLITLGRGLFWA